MDSSTTSLNSETDNTHTGTWPNNKPVIGLDPLPRLGMGGALIPPLIPAWSEPFKQSRNEIEGKTWFEIIMDSCDTIVIKLGDKEVKMSKDDFIKRLGLEW